MSLLLLVPPLALAPDAAAAPGMPIWGAVPEPTGGPARVIGRYGAACIAGAVSLPLDGVGYQVIDPSRRRNYGHPMLIDYLGELGRAVAAHKLGLMLVGDMAQPRGGPMTFGHVSHQGGLDVDVWFRLDRAALPHAQRDGLVVPSVIDPATGHPDPARWTPAHAELVRLAASDPRVVRVFVGAAIKRDLCQRAYAADPADPAADRRWLHVVRTWPGHDDHLHVRLRCPSDSPECIDQPPLPAGDGCSPAALELALARERALRRRRPPAPSGSVPPACGALLADAANKAVPPTRVITTLNRRDSPERKPAIVGGAARGRDLARRMSLAGRGSSTVVD